MSQILFTFSRQMIEILLSGEEISIEQSDGSTFLFKMNEEPISIENVIPFYR